MANIYLFHGADTFRSLNKLREWKEAFVKKYGSGTVREVEAGEEILMLSEVTRGSSLFNPTQLLVVRNFQAESGGVDLEDLLALIEKGLDKNTHLLLWQNGSLDKRLNFTKAINKLNQEGKIQITEFPQFGPQEALKFIATELKLRGFKIAADAGELLVEFTSLTGGLLDSGRAVNAINQLAAFCAGKDIISASDVEAVVAPSQEADAFLPMLRAFTKKDKKEFYKHLETVSANAASEQELLGVISAFFEQAKTLLMVLTLKEEGLSAAEIDKKLDFKPGRSRFVIADLQKFKKEDLEGLLKELVEIEFKQKLSKTVLAPALAGLLK